MKHSLNNPNKKLGQKLKGQNSISKFQLSEDKAKPWEEELTKKIYAVL